MNGTTRKRTICKVLCLALIACVLFSLAACGRGEKQITSLDELDGKNIAVLSGSIYAALIKQDPSLSDVRLTYVSSNADGLAWLFGRKTDALVTDYVMAQTLIRKYDGLAMLDETLHSAEYGVVFRKGDPLRGLFNDAIAEMKADGTISGMIEIWMGDDDSAKTVPEQTWAGSRGTLKCRLISDAEPICYKNDAGELIGFDVDLALRIAEKLDYKLEFSTGEAADLIPAVAAGQADFAASGITVTEDRAEYVDFSDGYLDDSTVVLVRDEQAQKTGTGFALSAKNSLRRVFLDNGRWADLLRGLGMTLLICVLSAITGGIFGVLIFLWDYSGSKFANKLLSIIERFLLLLPLSTWLLIVLYIIFAGSRSGNFWMAIFAFTFTFGFAVFGDLKDAVSLVNKGQEEAAFSMGYGRYKALWKIFLPQAMPRFLSAMQAEVIGHIRGTSLVGYLSVLDIQAVADNIRAETFEPFVPIILTAVVYIVLAALASRLVGRIKIKVNPTEKTEEEILARLMKGKI